MKIKLCSDDLFTVMKAPTEETVGEAGSHDYGESQLDHNDHDLFSHPTNKPRKHSTLSSSILQASASKALQASLLSSKIYVIHTSMFDFLSLSMCIVNDVRTIVVIILSISRISTLNITNAVLTCHPPLGSDDASVNINRF